jgi:CheY-like chemotaxis protein
MLRLVADNTSDRGGAHGIGAPKTSNGHHRKPTILVVEDEILIRLATADFLRANGYRVLEASNADEALAILAAGEPIELVFSDVNMPGQMDGEDLAEWIKQSFPDVKVILTSGDKTETSAPLIRKPYDYNMVLAEISRALKK